MNMIENALRLAKDAMTPPRNEEEAAALEAINAALSELKHAAPGGMVFNLDVMDPPTGEIDYADIAEGGDGKVY